MLLNKKGLAIGTLIVLVLIIVSFLVLVVFVSNLNEIESYESSRWMCKLSILIGQFKCKTFGPITLDNEKEVAAKITDAWNTFFQGTKSILYGGIPIVNTQINCFGYMRFKVSRDMAIVEINKILSKDHIEFKGISNKLESGNEYVIEFVQKYEPCIPLLKSKCIDIQLPPRGKPVKPVLGVRTTKIYITSSKNVVSEIGCDYVQRKV
jgi:hypothetical protein